MATEPAAPPWDWNPGATFVEAFNESRRTRLMQEKAEQEAELNRILFPLKAQQAALELDKLQMEVERGAMTNQIYRKALRQSHSGQMQGLRDIDRSISGTTTSRWGLSRYGVNTTPSQSAASPKPRLNWSVVQPAATSPEP